MYNIGLQLLYSKILGGPSGEELKDLYGTYGDQDPDTKWYERLKDPEVTGDVVKFGGNLAKDLVQFFPDIIADTFQAGISQLAQTELYNPLSEEGQKRELERTGFFPHIPGVDFMGPIDMLEPEWKYKADATFTDWLGEKLGTDVPSIMKDNPFENAIYDEEGRLITYHNPSYKKIEKQAEKEVEDYYHGKYGIFTEEKAEEIDRMTTRALPVAKWAEENYNTDPKEYDKAWKEEWGNQFNNRYAEEKTDFFFKSVDGQLLGKYNIGGKKTSPLREYEMGFNVPLPFTDKTWDVGYAWGGKPFLHQLGEPFTYAPERRDVIERVHGIAELPAGFGLRKLPSKIMDRISKRFKSSRGADEPWKADKGIMGAKRLEGPKYDYDRAKEWMRTGGR